MSAKLKYDFEKEKNSSQRKIRSLSCGQRQENNKMNQSMMDGQKDEREGRWNGRMEWKTRMRWKDGMEGESLPQSCPTLPK